MIIGDMVFQESTLNPGGNMHFQPDPGVNYALQYYGSRAEFDLCFVKSSTGLEIRIISDDDTGFPNFNALPGVLHCSNDINYKIINRDGASQGAAFSGMVSNDGSHGSVLAQDIQTIGSGSFLTIQPPLGEEWIIESVMGSGIFSLYYSIGGQTFHVYDNKPANSMASGMNLPINNSNYLLIKNSDTGSKVLGYDGVKTKVVTV